ncbi:MAG: hypothetical protein JWO58_3321 [Chitinophagaceae bacterium]|nr:hypothetical protein [Chitinophagaceae bacterium]
MVIFSKELREAIGGFLSGEEHSDRAFEALNDEDDEFVLTFLRGSVVPMGWVKIRRHFDGLDEDQLILAAEELLKISYREETLQGLLSRCRDEIAQKKQDNFT